SKYTSDRPRPSPPSASMDQPTISTAPLSITLLLGIEAADPMRLGHPADALHQGRRSQRDLFALGRRPDPVDGARHDLLKTRDDLALPPEVVLEPLHPLEVRHDDPARVGENVRNHPHPALVEDRMCLRGGGPVGSLYDEGGLHPIGVPLVDLRSDRGRYEEAARLLDQVRVRDRLPAPGGEPAADAP